MNANQLMTRILRLFLRKAIDQGMDKGIEMASRRQGGPATPPDPRAQAQARETQKRARQAMRIARRFGRF